ncbi:hypothetical protein [Vogesella fluminis]|uniref:Uncharacterized protein n=1 Tax=Vogesella fluminis TaxID=1069161 RepID=A0ABQ3HE74_9NEIS|nr:hypothetical protein [Vogesella fluminis]GHD82384.1 hypothetical protein GCM10011419_29780 [Vogesella fluminis]
MKCWTYDTRYGPFEIVPLDGRYHIMHEGEALAAYPTPEEAAKALAEGHSPWPPLRQPARPRHPRRPATMALPPAGLSREM